MAAVEGAPNSYTSSMKLIADNKSSGSEEEIQMHKLDQEADSDLFEEDIKRATDLVKSNMTFLAKGDVDGESEGTTWIVRGNASESQS